MRIKINIIIIFLATLPISMFGQISLPKLISDGMVLQRDTEIKIWGWASANETLEISFIDSTYKTIADSVGNWEFLLESQKAGGPYTMVLKGINELRINNILIGEVWLFSGQSNMEINMQRVSPLYLKEIAEADFDEIRYFYVPREYDFNEERQDLSYGKWESTTPKSVLSFSAISYFFGYELYTKYKVPIGLINASLGGSPAECWLNEEMLKEFPNHYSELQEYKDANFVAKIKSDDKIRIDGWHEQLNSLDAAYANPDKIWSNSDLDISDWKVMNIPGYWPEKTNGSVWFRKEFQVPESMVGIPAKLNIGRIVDADFIYVNGKLVGNTTYQYPPRRYNIPSNLLKKGKNTIAIRVISEIDSGGFVEDKPYEIIANNAQIDLKGPWSYKIGAVMNPLQPQTFIRWKPAGLFNAMISPLTNYSIKGIIWYQGESNVGKHKEYETLFPAVIKCWRQEWNQDDLPFIYAQLPNYLQPNEKPSNSDWASLREVQLKTLSVPNTAMTTNIDLGEWNDIHPLNKKDVAKRLALGAYKIAYNESDLVSSGPTYESMKIEGNKIRLTFSNCENGLISKNGSLQEFAIAGKDKVFVWADAKIEGNTIVVSSEKITEPIAVRYAWADNPHKANLYNKAGLPASPFRTDDW